MFKFNFNWFKKKEPVEEQLAHEYVDAIEHALWEIKEEYDFPTEEIDVVVRTKRKNFDFLHEESKKRNKPK
jgi:hypothetical protein